ncbi:MAG: DUF1905 domain-containing protein [Ilumatobacter sp.]|jgi:hypothetical protein|uniref:DUF1905 domain-containing protein n=1 Tax=Ilumatobacter sp. TaxID=1967498 RepID=UPI00391B3FAA
MMYRFDAELWEWEAKASWFFISVPHEVADEIEERFGRVAGGFGSVRVEVTVGASTWRTSIFPSKVEATYVLPIKKAVRVAERLEPGSNVATVLTVIIE